jgi:hypothetical protein
MQHKGMKQWYLEKRKRTGYVRVLRIADAAACKTPICIARIALKKKGEPGSCAKLQLFIIVFLSSSRPAHEERSGRANGPVELAHLACRRLGGRPQVDVVLIRSRRLGGRCPISDAVGSLGCQGEGLGSALVVVYVRQGAMRVVVWWEVECEVHYDGHFVSIGGARVSGPLSSPWVRGFGGRGRARLCQHRSCLAGAEIDVERWYGFVHAACVSGFGDINVYGAATDRSGSRWDG